LVRKRAMTRWDFTGVTSHKACLDTPSCVRVGKGHVHRFIEQHRFRARHKRKIAAMNSNHDLSVESAGAQFRHHSAEPGLVERKLFRTT
jgi:hypothetical protein